ncbi:MAG TPA: hypothetical protein VEX70_13240 [Pyrinomonadaceae bacterium]|jgi:hypothetical protein|nr:hypothetical protein [Pyrinomonadaceae bacterium]
MNKNRGKTGMLSTLSTLSTLRTPLPASNSRRRLLFAVAAFCALGLSVVAPRALALPPQERAREARAIPAGEVVVTLNERLFNALLEAMFTLPNPPTFPLAGRGNSSAGGGKNCASEISLAREMNGTRSAVRFQAGRIVAPVAFSGSYSAPLVGCLKFEGWADTNLNLNFDAAKQALTARVEVKAVHLKKVPALFGDGITGLVQDALDARFNPVEILRAEQLSARLPMTKTGSGASLRLRAREVRHEVLPNELRLRILYEFVREE